jgi:hypothetical protein
MDMKNNQAKQLGQNNVDGVLRRKLTSLLHWFAGHAQLEIVYPVQQPHVSMKALEGKR